MKTKEHWIDEAMESLNGIQPATGDPFIYDKVMHRMNSTSIYPPYFRPRILWQIAAGLTLLITINIFSVVKYTKSAKTEQTQVKTLATEYFSYIDTINI